MSKKQLQQQLENPLRYITKSKHKLTVKETRFCYAYIENMGNGTEAARTAEYGGTYLTIRKIASDNLTKPHILECIRELYEKSGLNDEIVDAELAFVVKQHANVNAKIKGIHEYNDVKGRLRGAPLNLNIVNYEGLLNKLKGNNNNTGDSANSSKS